MADVEVAIAQEPAEPHHDVKLFNRWSFDDVQVSISFQILQICSFSHLNVVFYSMFGFKNVTATGEKWNLEKCKTAICFSREQIDAMRHFGQIRFSLVH